MAERKIRMFKRWMKSQLIDCSDALDLVLTDDAVESSTLSFSVYVKALHDLHEGDVVARIPKESCLTVKTSRACHVIEEAGLDGFLGLAVALMYEISLGALSRWFGYLQILPHSEPIPLLWSIEEIDSLLAGTELQKIIKEDKDLIYEDWKECIQPLLDSSALELNPNFFGIEQYFAARSLIASRSFEIDDYHGYGMVPLADLFNHKTGAEDVHFTSTPSQFQSDNDSDDDNRNNEDEDNKDAEPITQESYSEKLSLSESDAEISSCSDDDPTVLEMIMVKDVKVGDEVFNTYGSSGNAALLHRYGFTESDNPYDIVNIDLELVLQWSSSVFTHRHSRTRLSLWRKLDYPGCESQNSEYFEISFDGEPQVELLVLLYIMLLEEKGYHELDLAVSTTGGFNKIINSIPLGKGNFAFDSSSTLSKNLLLNVGVRKALLYLADMRESLYNSNSLQDDIEALKKCSHVRDRKLYHSLVLRISERRILEKLRSYASGAGKSTDKRATTRISELLPEKEDVI